MQIGPAGFLPARGAGLPLKSYFMLRTGDLPQPATEVSARMSKSGHWARSPPAAPSPTRLSPLLYPRTAGASSFHGNRGRVCAARSSPLPGTGTASDPTGVGSRGGAKAIAGGPQGRHPRCPSILKKGHLGTRIAAAQIVRATVIGLPSPSTWQRSRLRAFSLAQSRRRPPAIRSLGPFLIGQIRLSSQRLLAFLDSLEHKRAFRGEVRVRTKTLRFRGSWLPLPQLPRWGRQAAVYGAEGSLSGVPP